MQDGFFTKDSGFWILCKKDSGLFWILCKVLLEKDSGILDSLQKGFWTLLDSLQRILGFWILCKKDSGLFRILCKGFWILCKKDSGLFWILCKGFWDSGFFAERILGF